ncbi:hypothetical protein AURANDRAFT_22815 [Aureococcus anophagefferens]|uniref:type I protein arginine methyltransferase n=1 Tax=Aureococcus anophagefferens TaxID=44056 RepID=F0Y4F5_AURAN|nr:hypothetical protein AURANDRAFT_22815 [Aureococcus anophagefferens]EGB10402.1 hypothetical protein AURANDRAFT_22815 [Aureococcus anophagefferens]|eukprot:XP_009035202.1 hypothetical protein AURANDRAFT_22815 [Aureococcus anophagefferens]
MDDDDEKKPPDPSPFGVYYARLLHQQNMLQDAVRTETYRRAIVTNAPDLTGKVVLDVGAGTGILSFFAAQAGAGRVYAVEASGMAEKAAKLLSADAAWDAMDKDFRVHVVKGKVEDVTIPEHVDVIVSEPLGAFVRVRFLLVHERMLEAFVAARDRFLRPGGLMLPSTGTILVQPVTDGALWQEQEAKAAFWLASDFHGVDLTPLHEDALEEYFSQAVVGYFAPESALCETAAAYKFDFATCTVAELRDFVVPLDFLITKTAIMHGVGCWFDTTFDGSVERVVLSTSPSMPGTHWYQSRLLLRRPIAVNAGQRVTGTLDFKANDRLSYDVTLALHLEGTDIASSQVVRLDDQMYHYLAPGQVAMQPG